MSRRSVLAIGGNRFPFHRFADRGPELAAALGPGTDVRLTTDRDDLRDLAAHDVVLDYRTDSSSTDAQREGLCGFVENGGGYVGVHCAVDLTATAPSDSETDVDHRAEPLPALRALLGGHFLHHPEQGTFEVRVVDHYHPITAALDDVRVWDEPYVVDVDAWTKAYGDGRIFYSSLGHGTPALTHPGVQELIRNGTRWAAGDA